MSWRVTWDGPVTGRRTKIARSKRELTAVLRAIPTSRLSMLRVEQIER